MAQKIKAVVFDLDNVLANTLHLHNEQLVKTVEKYGAKSSIEKMQQLTGIRVDHIFEEVLKENNIEFTPELISKMVKEKKEAYLANIKTIRAVPGAKEFVNFVQSLGLKIAIASGSLTEIAKGTLEESGIHLHFDIVIGGDMVERAKPEPDIYLLAAEKLNVKPEECIAIEDAMHGTESAKKAGMKVIGFINPESGKQDLSSADMLFDDFFELPLKFNDFLANL